MPIVVVGSERGSLFVTEGAFPPVLPMMMIRIGETGTDTCKVSRQMFSRNDRFWFKHTMIPMAKSVMQKRADVGLKRLKGILEN